MAIELPAPNAPSALIKTCRWTALLAGIYWGVHRYRVNKATEDEIREYNATMKPIWDAEKAAKAAALNRDQMIYLANATGTPIPKDF